MTTPSLRCTPRGSRARASAIAALLAGLSGSGCTDGATDGGPDLSVAAVADLLPALDLAPIADLSPAGCVPSCVAPNPVCGPSRRCVACVGDGDCPAGSVCKTIGGLVSACVPGCSGDTGCAGGDGGVRACCGGSCADTSRDLFNCGACGAACAIPHASSLCTASQCSIGACNAGWADCDRDPANGCETALRNDVANCGACGTACAYNHGVARCAEACYLASCNYGWDDCNGDDSDGCEHNVLGDAANCGACGQTCGPFGNAQATCANEVCTFKCAPLWGDCDGNFKNGCELSLSANNANCGACNNACPMGQVCKAGACTCPLCDHAFQNATAKCINNQCVFDQCRAGFFDCNNDVADGCEANLLGDAANCGKCGALCGGQTPFCLGGACTRTGVNCAAISAGDPNSKDGLYMIDPDGNGGNPPFTVYCDMSTDGGGWTLVYREQSDQNAQNFNSTGAVGGLPLTPQSLGKLSDAVIQSIVGSNDPNTIGYRWTIDTFIGTKYHPSSCRYANDTNPKTTGCDLYTDSWSMNPAFQVAPTCDGFAYKTGGLKATKFGGYNGGNVAWSNWNQEGHAIQGDNTCQTWHYTSNLIVTIWARK